MCKMLRIATLTEIYTRVWILKCVVYVQVLGCVTDLLLSDPAPQVQQSALLVLTLLLKGLSHRSVEVLGGSLQEVYRLLKRVEGERERDEVTREHARAALAELEQIMKEWTFPKPSLTYFEP